MVNPHSLKSLSPCEGCSAVFSVETIVVLQNKEETKSDDFGNSTVNNGDNDINKVFFFFSRMKAA